MVNRDRASIIARRAAQGIPRTQDDPSRDSSATAQDSVRISARISAHGRDALRRLAAAHGLSVAALVDLVGTAANDQDDKLIDIVTARAEAHRRAWGGPR